METPALLALAVALAMDALAVAVATGCRLRTVSARQTLRLAWHFGLFQAAMPIAGWFMGQGIRSFVDDWAHWIAFGLLAFIGLKMLKEAFEHDDAECGMADPTRGTSLIMLSVATSIDALAVGVTLSMLGLSIWMPAAVIGLVCLGLTAAGVQLGRVLAASSALSRYAEILGGAVLLGIGFKILHESGVFG
jgi:putative Mn2+ efflux pump MntP